MKFDTPMVMMLGVVGLGAFAAYRMTRTKGSEPQTTEPGLLSSLKLDQNTHYQGRLALKELDIPPLSSSKDQLVQFLKLLGFRDVQVYMTADELPFNWAELKSGGSNNRWFEGTWNNASATLPRPKQIDRLSKGGNSLISGMTG